jgi:Ca2+-binding EF-hand superfamily protein
MSCLQANLRDQFMSFDLNEDGLIDHDELSMVLDQLGDKTGVEEREDYFRRVDYDGSNGVDFEEFLAVRESL